MAAIILGGAGGKAAAARNTLRRSVAALLARDGRGAICGGAAARFGLDDAAVASIGADRAAQECLARRVLVV